MDMPATKLRLCAVHSARAQTTFLMSCTVRSLHWQRPLARQRVLMRVLDFAPSLRGLPAPGALLFIPLARTRHLWLLLAPAALAAAAWWHVRARPTEPPVASISAPASSTHASVLAPALHAHAERSAAFYCANAGICSRDSAQDVVSSVVDAAVPRQGADRVD
ncbi:hypothetical protein XpopCFBP1817_08170 [Xanthomonas populi]|uniref:Uncharacterized protein n=1 Tax=Xanthomonas populi TaxID=53414 RepID=A0A2S7ER99_9XANT|nr:hypothetical protein XpopCFBP1817_08170 [Xanthomonas populi]